MNNLLLLSSSVLSPLPSPSTGNEKEWMHEGRKEGRKEKNKKTKNKQACTDCVQKQLGFHEEKLNDNKKKRKKERRDKLVTQKKCCD